MLLMICMNNRRGLVSIPEKIPRGDINDLHDIEKLELRKRREERMLYLYLYINTTGYLDMLLIERRTSTLNP